MRRFFVCLIFGVLGTGFAGPVFDAIGISRVFSVEAVVPVQSSSDAPIIDYSSPFHPVYGERGMVVAQETYAAEAGKEILKAGGNAVDAAVATGFALAVTHPQAGNLAGGGFMLIYVPAEKRTVAIDYREKAPAATNADFYLTAQGQVDRAKKRFSHNATGVPGTVDGLILALEKYGTLPLGVVMAPAIRLAEQGFPMTWGLSDSLARYQRRFENDPASQKYFGGDHPVGQIWQQPDLAATLKKIAAEGRDGFYKGHIADLLIKSIQQGGGVMTHQDLAGYKSVEREPVTGEFRGYHIATMPPPSSGGVHIIQMLNILKGYDLKSMGQGSAAYSHVLVEAMKFAYADRSKYLGDPDYVDVPVTGLSDQAYADHLRQRIKQDLATPSDDIAPAPSLPFESPDTTHFSAADMSGMVVSNTYTLNFSYGNGKSVDGGGFLLNNEMDDFTGKIGVANAYGLIGGKANSVEAGKRPLSSMTPVLVFKDGVPFMASGSPGGSTIITAVLQTLLNVMEFDMNIMAATIAPRLHHQWYPDSLRLEPTFSPDTVRLLGKMGHQIPGKGGQFRVLGATQSILINNGIFYGGPDPRRPGSHAAAW